METCRPRALRSRPMLAAVMPFPREEVTPPVTKTYFAIGQASGGFSNAIGKHAPGRIGTAGRSGLERRLAVIGDGRIGRPDGHTLACPGGGRGSRGSRGEQRVQAGSEGIRPEAVQDLAGFALGLD